MLERSAKPAPTADASTAGTTLDRRGLLKGAAALVGAAVAGVPGFAAVAQAPAAAKAGGSPALIVASDGASVVETTAGKVRGARYRDIHTYLFAWQTPILDGRPRAFHCSELPFVFNNTDRCAAMTGGTDEARALGERVSDAWISFARSGDPNHKGLPAWPAFDPQRGPVMVFDTTCAVKNDPDRAARQVITSAT